jgi:CubicO group peptidase (beta-lactamase class C family)
MHLEPLFDLVRRQSTQVQGRYAAIGVATAAGPVGSAAFVRGERLADPPRSPIASLTKPITATAIMQLVEDGAVTLDEPIASYVPELAAEPRDHAAIVTVRHVLSHTSGLVDLPDTELVTLPPTPTAMTDAMCGARLRFAPGSAFQYASEPWYLLSAIVERASGSPFAAFVRDRILWPLGMTATTFDPRDHGPAHLQPAGHFPTADIGADDMVSLMAGLVMPGGGLWSTPDDMLRFGRAMLLGGTLDGTRILDRSSVDAMVEPQTRDVVHAGTGDPVHYGLGWGLRPGWGASESAFAHSGATGSMLVVDPARDLVIVYLRNWWGTTMDATNGALEAAFAAISR